MNQPQLIVALDTDSFKDAQNIVTRLKDSVHIYKVGSQLFTACGRDIMDFLMNQEKKIFLDLKFHDIPHTVANAVKSAILLTEDRNALMMLTLHTIGGLEMLQAAVQSAKETVKNLKCQRPLLVGVTVLTSDAKADNIHSLILERAQLAKDAGLDGVVASAQEAVMIREKFGKDFVIVTPGIRPEGHEAQDQKRVTTPAQAVANGSHFLVVGRPILQAPDPLQATQEILKEMSGDSR